MARDGSETREALLVAGQRLFAAEGVYQVPLKAIVDAAGQRNVSALHYHFGGRDGLLQAILDQHNASIEHERAAMLDRLDGQSGVRPIVEAFVIPFSRKLQSAEGREFLKIVAHLVDLFDLWDSPRDRTPTQAARALGLLADQLPVPEPAIRHDRITLFLGLVADALATRARRLSRSADGHVPHDVFVANIIDMSVGALSAMPGEM